jgi:hypothetical protein
LRDGLPRAFEKNKRVIGILKDGVGGVRNKRVLDCTSQGRMMEKPTKEVSNNNEEVG